MKSLSKYLVAALMLLAMASASAVILGAVNLAQVAKSADAVVTGRLLAFEAATDGHDEFLDLAADRVLRGAVQPGQVVRVAIPDGARTDRLRAGGYALFFLKREARGWRLDDGDGSVAVATSTKPLDADADTVDARIAGELVSALASDDATLASSYGDVQLAVGQQHAVAGLMRREVVSELATLPAAVIKPPILKAAAADPPDLRVQLDCAAALLRARDASLLQAIVPALLHVDPRQAGSVKDLARWYRLGDWDASQAPTAKALLGSDDADVKSAAAVVLAKIEARPVSADPADAGVRLPMQHETPE